jgi:3-hydroxybutyryl-CoA dehydrogenase
MHCNILNLLALKFDFCAFCAFLRLYQSFAEDVDTVIKMGMGIRLPAWGPLEHIDAVGLDLALSVQKRVLPALFNDPGPTRRLKDLVEKGNLGHKTGSGFYDWKVKDMDSLSQTRDQLVMQTLRFFKREDHLQKS